jgi:hypothetical protein
MMSRLHGFYSDDLDAGGGSAIAFADAARHPDRHRATAPVRLDPVPFDATGTRLVCLAGDSIYVIDVCTRALRRGVLHDPA